MTSLDALPGLRVDRLTIGSVADGCATWRCDCGVEGASRLTGVLGGAHRACRCFQRRAWTDGAAEHQTWRGMLERCYSETCVGFSSYGARGIAVAHEWLGRSGFFRFLAHIGRKPSDRYSIDRIDGAKSYEPGNVRWATLETQLANRRPTTKEHRRLHAAKMSALVALRRQGKLWTASATSALCSEIMGDLEANFGRRVETIRPQDCSVEWAWLDCEFGLESHHLEGVEDMRKAVGPALKRHNSHFLGHRNFWKAA